MSLTAAQLKVIIGADISGATKGIDTVQGKLSGFAGKAALTGAALTAGLTLPLVGVAKQALDTATSYQSSMNMLQAVTSASASQMNAMGQEAIALGSDMSLPATSAADAGTAMTELAKAGLSVNDTMGAAKGVLELSAAGNLDNATAAEIAADALNAFHLQGSKATDVANLLAGAANASSGEVTDMADAMKASAAVFASAGQPIDSLVTGISEMANAGIKGQDAGTSLKQMMLSLEAPTKKAAGTMKDMGINIYDAQGKMLPFRDIVGQFSDKMSGLTQEQRNQALATIFGSDAVRSANIVLMGGVQAYDQMHTAVTKQNAAATLATARMKGLGGAFEGLKSQVETLMLQGTQPFMGTLEDIVRSAGNLIPQIANLNPSLLAAAGAFVAVLAVAGPVLLIVGAMAGALAFLLSPIGIIVLAVALLAAAWASDFGGIREITGAVIAFILPLFQSVAAWFTANWPVMRALVQDTFNAIRTVIQTVIGFVTPFILKEGGVITAWWTANMPLMQKTAETIFHAIQAVVDFVMPYIQTLIQAVMPIIEAYWTVEWTVIQAVLNVAWQAMQIIVDTVIRNILSIIKVVMLLINGDWQGAWDEIKAIFKRTWDATLEILKIALDTLWNSILAPALDALGINWRGAWDGISQTVADTWNGIIQTVKDGVNTVISDLNHLIDAYNGIHLHIGGFTLNTPAGVISWPGFDEGVTPVAHIPMLAAGGIITSPTLAMIGERGPEAVIPLNRTGAAGIDYARLADAIVTAQARRPSYQITANYRYQDERSLRDDVRLLSMLGAGV